MKITKEEIDRMVKIGIVRPLISPWSSPIVMVRKKNGEWRLLRRSEIKCITKKAKYCLPSIDEIFDQIGTARVFSTLDAQSGYWQVAMHPDDVEKTVSSPRGEVTNI